MSCASINKDSAPVAYLKNFFSVDKDEVDIKETGLWLSKDGDSQNRLGSSLEGSN